MKKILVSACLIQEVPQEHIVCPRSRAGFLFLTTLIFLASCLSGSPVMASSLRSRPQIAATLKHTDKLCRWESHHTFLTKCTDKNIIPKGMKLRFGMDALPKCAQLSFTIRDIMRTAEKQILMACRDSYRALAEQQLRDLHQILYENFQNLDFHSFEHLLRLQKRHYFRKKERLNQIKKNKLSRLIQVVSSAGISSDTTPSSQVDITNKTRRKNRRFTRHKPVPRIHKDTTNQSRTVVNLSDITLTDNQTTLLMRGAKYCPTPLHLDQEKLSADVMEGCRKLRLKELHFREGESPPSPPRFYKPSGFEPQKGRDHGLDTYCNLLHSRTESYKPERKRHDNLSREERRALEELRNMVTSRIIRITQADKGGAVVIQNVKDYLTEAQRQLDNTDNYLKVKKDPTVQIAKTSNDIVRELETEGYISEQTRNWALTDTRRVRTPLYYHLPKIHKHLQDPPGRPIISGTEGPTEKLSRLVDFWLQSHVAALPSHIKDSTHVLNLLHDWNVQYGPFQEVTLVTIDVTSLYTNIPHEDAMEALHHFLELRPSPDTPPVDFIVNAANHILQNNFFHFEGEIFHQIHGTAMGTPLAPSVANLFMGRLEQRILENSPVAMNADLWKRYIDDILLLWLGSQQDLNTFLKYINTVHRTIKFTSETSTCALPFLDINIIIQDGFLQSDLYSKPTDAHNFLHYTSAHPNHCRKNIPYSQFLRLRRLCSREEIFKERCREMTGHLQNRGYPTTIIQQALDKIKKIPRHETLQYKHKAKNTRLPFIVTHNPSNPPLRQWFRELLPHLHTSSRMQKAAPDPPILGERNCRSLRNIIMPSALPTEEKDTHPPGCYRCHRKRCIVCEDHLVEATTFTSANTKETYHIKKAMFCDTQDLIYLLFCQKCSTAQYVGETRNTLKQRFYGHRNSIKRDAGTHVTDHFRQPDHCLKDLKCIAIEKNNTGNHTYRLKRENFWFHKLETIWPSGLNAAV